MCVGNVFERRVPTWTFSPYGLAPIFVAVLIINIQRNMMNEKKDKSYKKNLEPTAKFIHDLCEQQEVTVSNLLSTKKKGYLSLNGRSMEVKLSIDIEEVGENADILSPESGVSVLVTSLQMDSDSGNYFIPEAYSLTSFPTCDSSGKCYIPYTLFLSQFMDFEWYKERKRRETWEGKRFERKKRGRKKRERKKRDRRWKKGLQERKYFYRFLVPLLKETYIRDNIQATSFYTSAKDSDDKLDSLVEIVSPGGTRIHIYLSCISIQGKTPEYLVIESQTPCTYMEMHEYMYAVSLSLGLVTSVAPFDYAFFVASETLDFDGNLMGGFIQLRPTIESQYRFFTTDLDSVYGGLKGKAGYAFRPYCDKDGNLLKDCLNPMQEQEFVALVSMLHRSKDLARAALMLIDSSMNLECMGVTYAVALETICSVLIETNKESFSDYFEKKPWDDEWISNKNKLTRPFDLPEIGYKLSEKKRKELLDIRNSFLHGGVLRFSHTEYHKLLYPCMELRKLCGILLLRYAGYKGPILNNAVEMGLEKALANKEPLFITYDEKTEAPQPTEKSETSV